MLHEKRNGLKDFYTAGLICNQGVGGSNPSGGTIFCGLDKHQG